MLGDSVRRRQRQKRPKRSGEGSRPARRGGRRIWPWVIAALLLPFGIGYVVAALVLFPPTEEAAALAGGVSVPELTGETMGNAERVLAEHTLVLLDATELPHPEAPSGEIIAQDPLPGQHLRPGAGVRVAISSGPPRARVPDIVGFPLERARELLQRLGFEVASVERPSDTPTGRVIGITPDAGSEQRLPATVTLVVSVGQPVTDDPTVDEEMYVDEPPAEAPIVQPPADSAQAPVPATPPDTTDVR